MTIAYRLLNTGLLGRPQGHGPLHNHDNLKAWSVWEWMSSAWASCCYTPHHTTTKKTRTHEKSSCKNGSSLIWPAHLVSTFLRRCLHIYMWHLLPGAFYSKQRSGRSTMRSSSELLGASEARPPLCLPSSHLHPPGRCTRTPGRPVDPSLDLRHFEGVESICGTSGPCSRVRLETLASANYAEHEQAMILDG